MIPYFSNKLSTCIFNCLLNMYTRVSKGHPKPNISKIELLIPPPKTALFTAFPISIATNSILQVTWANYLGLHLFSYLKFNVSSTY